MTLARSSIVAGGRSSQPIPVRTAATHDPRRQILRWLNGSMLGFMERPSQNAFTRPAFPQRLTCTPAVQTLVYGSVRAPERASREEPPFPRRT